MLEGIAWIGIGGIICVFGWTFNLGSLHEPAPGFVAFVSGIFLFSVGIVMVISKVISRRQSNHRSEPVQVFRKIPWRRLTYTVGFLLGYIFFFDALGYLLSTFLLMFGLFYDWEKKKWGSSLLFSTLTVLISYVIFEVWLRCQLPRGVLPWW